MRAETDRAKLEASWPGWETARGGGCVYLTGGATAVLHNWRPMTIDIDIKPDPEPPGLFEAIALLKNELDVNVELASPDQFIPRFRAGGTAACSSRGMVSFNFFTTTPMVRRCSSCSAGTIAMFGTFIPCCAKD